MKKLGMNAVSRGEYEEQYGVDYMRGTRHQLWHMPQINWDGKVLGCGHNYWGEFGGNAFQDGLLTTINSERMNYARDMLMGNKPAREGG